MGWKEGMIQEDRRGLSRPRLPIPPSQPKNTCHAVYLILFCPSLVYYISHTFPTISMGCGSWKPFAAETARRWDQLSPCVSWVRCKVASSQFEWVRGRMRPVRKKNALFRKNFQYFFFAWMLKKIEMVLEYCNRLNKPLSFQGGKVRLNLQGWVLQALTMFFGRGADPLWETF